MCSGSTGDVVHAGGALLDRPVLTEADRIVARLNEPEVAAAINGLLDRAELISALVEGLEQFLQRTDDMLPAVAAGLNEFRAAAKDSWIQDLANAFHRGLPAIQQVLDSELVKPATVEAAGTLAGAATAGVERARSSHAEVHGLLGVHRALKDPDVQRGAGITIEILRELGRVRAVPPSPNGAGSRA